MKRLFSIGAIVVLVLTCATVLHAQFTPYEGRGAWRVGLTYVTISSSSGDDALGGGWGAEAELGIARLLRGELTAIGSFKTFDESEPGFSNDLDYWTLGVKWRGGNGGTAGAGYSPRTDGFYYGWGAALAFLDGTIRGVSVDSTKMEWKLLAGLDFARSWYGEVNYNFIGSAGPIDADNWQFIVGYRF